MLLSTPIILTLPPELLQHIILFIDRPQHLLSLATSCRLFCEIIIPDILDHCETRCCFTQHNLWTILAERPILCQYIKYMHVPMQPWLNFPPGHTERSRISSALSSMRNMLSFRCTLKLSGSIMAPMIAEALNNSGCALQEFGLTTRWCWDKDSDDKHSVYSLFRLDLSSLTKISIAHNYFSTTDAHCAWKMLSNCPNLTHLHLDVCQTPEALGFNGPITQTNFLTSCHWPRLEHLTIKGFDIREGTDIQEYNRRTRTFFSRHVLLETLWITSALEFPSVPPHLQAVAFYPAHASLPSQMFQPLSTAQNLTHMSLFHYGRLSHFEQAGEFSSLKTCVLPPIAFDRLPQHLDYLAKFTKFAPNVEQMAIGATGNSRHEIISGVIRTLLPLKKLTVILQLFSSIYSSNSLNPSELETLQCAYEHPTLSYIDIEVDDEQFGRVNRCIRLLPREHSDPKPVFEVVPLSVINPDDWKNKWGGFFRGFP